VQAAGHGVLGEAGSRGPHLHAAQALPAARHGRAEVLLLVEALPAACELRGLARQRGGLKAGVEQRLPPLLQALQRQRPPRVRTWTGSLPTNPMPWLGPGPEGEGAHRQLVDLCADLHEGSQTPGVQAGQQALEQLLRQIFQHRQLALRLRPRLCLHAALLAAAQVVQHGVPDRAGGQRGCCCHGDAECPPMPLGRAGSKGLF